MQFRSLSALSPTVSRLALIGATLLALACFWVIWHPAPAGPPSPSHDVDLYRAIVDRVRAGQDYGAARVWFWPCWPGTPR